MNSWYNYIHSYFYPVGENTKKTEYKKEYENTVNQKESEMIVNSLLTQDEINFEKNIQKYNPKFKSQKPFIKVNQD